MKKVGILMLSVITLFLFYTNVIAAPLTVGATLPSGAVNVTVSKIIANPPYDGKGVNDTWPVKGTPSETSLTFGTLAELKDDDGLPLAVFGPADRRYYALDIAVSGGGFPAGVNWVNINFTDNSPTPIKVFGKKLSATYFSMKWVSATQNPDQVLLKRDILGTAQSFPSSQFQGFWLRLLVGVYTPPGPLNTDPQPAGAEPFTYTDVAAAYTGQLTIATSG